MRRAIAIRDSITPQLPVSPGRLRGLSPLQCTAMSETGLVGHTWCGSRISRKMDAHYFDCRIVARLVKSACA